ncbi:hypothetical protein PR048_024116 [Dryococelus australis]|uniref:Reverse transcriptase RNase H-like domain-containing protein n=1 Tax=Dryococelus australis TaxID=614101 RepID=A0ABQ9GW03_9NEOP|nr:hypothetical protein PR048_024116 [Dryococelus australis]
MYSVLASVQVGCSSLCTPDADLDFRTNNLPARAHGVLECVGRSYICTAIPGPVEWQPLEDVWVNCPICTSRVQNAACQLTRIRAVRSMLIRNFTDFSDWGRTNRLEPDPNTERLTENAHVATVGGVPRKGGGGGGGAIDDVTADLEGTDDSHTSVHLCLTAFGVGPLVFVRGSMNTEAYCNILDNEMLPTLWRFYGLDPCYFQDDNARCHIVLVCTELRPKSIAQLMEWLQEEWRRIPVDVLQTLVESMPDRVAAVIATRDSVLRDTQQQVQSHARSGDGALVVRAIVTLIVLALLDRNRGKRSKQAGNNSDHFPFHTEAKLQMYSLAQCSGIQLFTIWRRTYRVSAGVFTSRTETHGGKNPQFYEHVQVSRELKPPPIPDLKLKFVACKNSSRLLSLGDFNTWVIVQECSGHRPLLRATRVARNLVERDTAGLRVECLECFTAVSATCSMSVKRQAATVKSGTVEIKTERRNFAFSGLKEIVASPPVLGLSNSDSKYILNIVASDVGIVAVLSRIQDEKGFRELHCVTRGELLATVNATSHFCPYLYGRHFILRTNRASLRWLRNFKNPEGQMAWWIHHFQEYDKCSANLDAFKPILFRGGHVNYSVVIANIMKNRVVNR